MSSSLSGRWPALCCALVLSACGGGGSPAPAPPPPVDTSPPDTTLTATPAAVSNSANGAFTATSTETGSVFEASVDGGAYATVAATFTLSNLAEGAHSINVRARDAAGNIDATPATFSWSIDSQAPATTLATLTPVISAVSSASFIFFSEAGATFEVAVDGGAFATGTSPFELAGLADGAHSISVRARDAAGNVDATPSAFAWTVDTSRPLALIVFPTPVSYTDAAQLHVRGTASDSHTITSVSVNGIAATSSNAFSNWSALVPIAAGDNNLVVSVTDSFGNTNANAAQVSVANRGVALTGLRGLVLDGAHDRLLAADDELDAIIALRASDGYATIFSDATHGTGPPGIFSVVAVDAANNRAIALGADEVLSVDLTTGNRTVIPTAPYTPDTTFFAGATCNNPCTRLFSTTYGSAPGEAGVFSVDLISGVRTVISGGTIHLGSGRSLVGPGGMVLDTSHGAPRLLVTDTYWDAVIAVDIVTGERTVLSSAITAFARGTGPEIQTPLGLVVDAPNNRALVTNYVTGVPNQVVAVDLTTGNRTVLPISGTSSDYQSVAGVVHDPITQRLFLSAYPRANVVQVNLLTNQLTRFTDSNVGTGPMVGTSSVLLDAYAPSPSLLAGAFGGVVRVDLATGVRTMIATTNFPNGGPSFRPYYLQYDTRPGIPANRLFYTNDISSSTTLYSLDVATGLSTSLSTTGVIPYSPHPELPLDAANGRLLFFMEPTFGRSQIQQISVTTGTTGPVVADSTIGTPSFGRLNALAVENAPGLPQRIIGMDDQSILYAFETATGNRTIVSSNAAVGSGPQLAYADSIAINPATRRAFVVSGSHHSILEVDLLTGNRTMVSGRNLDDQVVRGTGPLITPLWSRIAADFSKQIAYVTSNSESILTVDLVSGDRVITAR